MTPIEKLSQKIEACASKHGIDMDGIRRGQARSRYEAELTTRYLMTNQRAGVSNGVGCDCARVFWLRPLWEC